MIITSKKTTKLNTSVSWRKNLKDAEGNVFATMRATIDERHPLGRISFSITDQKVYEANITEAQQAYRAFQSEVLATANNITTSSESTEEA